MFDAQSRICQALPRPPQVEQMLGAARLQESVQHPNVLRVEAVLRADPGPCVILEPAHRDVSDLFTHDAIPGARPFFLPSRPRGFVRLMHPPNIEPFGWT